MSMKQPIAPTPFSHAKPPRQTSRDKLYARLVIRPSRLERRTSVGRLTGVDDHPVLKKMFFLLGGAPVALLPGILWPWRPCTAADGRSAFVRNCLRGRGYSVLD
jgi:hypothetical protein